VAPIEGPTSSGTRRTSFGIGTRPEVPSLASQAESWRTKGYPLPEKHTHSRPPAQPSQQQQSEPQTTLATLVGAPLALDHVADIVEGPMADLQVVDFLNMADLVRENDEDKESKSEKQQVDGTRHEAQGRLSTNKIRPTASDFFDDKSKTMASIAQAENNVWKRKTSANAPVQADEKDKDKNKVVFGKDEQTSSNAPIVSRVSASPHPRSRSHVEASMSALDDAMSRIKGALDGMQANGAASKENRPHVGTSETEQHPHPPVSRTFCPQPLSSSSVAAKHVSRERWQPAPLAQSLDQQVNEENLEALRESPSTSTDPLCLPPPSDASSSSVPPVHLPNISHKIEPVSPKQQTAFSRAPPQPRYECLSFDPPVLGMKKREFTVDSVLFKPPHGNGYKSNRIRVSLPAGTKKNGLHIGPRTVSLAPKYAGGGNGSVGGGFGKADGAISWRKGGTTHMPAGAVAKVEEDKKKKKKDFMSVKQKNEGENKLDVNVEEASMEKQVQDDLVTNPQVATRMMRQQPKMPAGSVVAFIRDSRIDAVEVDPKPLVNFIVRSELDEPIVEAFSGCLTEVEKKGSIIKGEDVSVNGVSFNNLIGSSSSPDGAKTGTEASSLATTSLSSPSASAVGQLLAPETKSMEVSVSTSCWMRAQIDFPLVQATISSISSASSPGYPSTTTSWGRSSLNAAIKDPGNVRVPDPEHLKAVWSQPNKAAGNSVNSLQDIVDDLATVNFSIQDVKSEDGETPPSTLPTTASRMSLHEVTKAFQKVPSSPPPSNSSTTQNRNPNPISPPSSSDTPATRSPYSYSPLSPTNAIRMSHPLYDYSSQPPSQTVIYSHQVSTSPVTSRLGVNGHGHGPPMRMYSGPPLWIPPGSGPGNPGAVMRPLLSPYPTHMVPFATPSYGHPMGAMATPQPQPVVGTNAAAGRGRGMPMHLSPAVPHAHAQTHPGGAMYATSPVMMPMQPVPQHNHAATAYMGVPPPPPPAVGTPVRGQSRIDIPQASCVNALESQSLHHHHHQPLPPPPLQLHQHQQQQHTTVTYNPASYVRSPW